MKKANGILIFLLSVMLCMTLTMAQNAYADSINVGNIIKFYDGPGSPGGEFGIKKKIGDNNYTDVLFMTFCLEKTEYIDFSSEFKVVSISEKAINGGLGPEGDPIDIRTAYLYYQFRMGTLDGYDSTSANDLQNAIWFIEGEGGAWNNFVALAEEATGGGQWKGLGNVAVMNLVYLNGTLAQSQLVLVPEPSTLLLLGVGLIGLGILGRKKFRTKP